MTVTHDNSKSREIQPKSSMAVVRKTGLTLTELRIARLKCPAGLQRQYHYDGKVRRLALSVLPSGSKTWVLYWKQNGRPERKTLGRWPDISLTRARQIAEADNAMIAEGKNPANDRRKLKAECTLAELWNSFSEEGKQRRTWRNMESLFTRHLAPFHHLKLSQITPSDAAQLHARIGKKKPYQANRAIELLHSLYEHANALVYGGWDGKNPCHGIKPFREVKRERFLNGEELKAFFRALQAEDQTWRDFFLLLLLTGVRRSNLQACEWSEIDKQKAVWKIPAAKAKAGEPIYVPLVPEALEILERRSELAKSRWVFPSFGASGHLMEVKTAWSRIVKAAKLENVRPHDLRRTCASWAVGTGASLPVVGKLLGHRSQSATAIYAKLELDPIRQALTKSVGGMLLAGDGIKLLV